MIFLCAENDEDKNYGIYGHRMIMVIISTMMTWMMSMRMRLVIMIISSSNMSDKEKDMKYNEKWCRQASCNSSTKSKMVIKIM